MARSKIKPEFSQANQHALHLAEEKKAPMRKALLQWFAAEQRNLPWRASKDAYRVWVSEVMLQQTQVERVKEYFARFVSSFPDVESLASASLSQVLEHWRGLGYYSRAKNLHLAAIDIVSRFDGRLPRSVPELLTLKGFGRYTAGAVASIAYGTPAPIVDGNVARVFSRLFAIETPPTDAEHIRLLWTLSERLVDANHPGDFNQSLMELGATVCTPKNPGCLLCPVRPLCEAHAQFKVDVLPKPKKAPPRVTLELAVAVCFAKGKVLLARRRETGLFAGLWELPGLTMSQEAALPQNFAVLLGTSARVQPRMSTVERTLTHRDLVLHLYPVTLSGKPKLASKSDYLELNWFRLDALGALGMSSAATATLEAAAPLFKAGQKRRLQ
jgi:A/G-specific adenine glycosylase